MLEPEERTIYACRTCRDHRLLMDGPKDVKCHDCAGWDEGTRLSHLRAETARRGEKPSITVNDLTDEEEEVYTMWRRNHPDAHQLTILTWIEGCRYNPREDVDFLALCDRRIKKWRFLRGWEEADA